MTIKDIYQGVDLRLYSNQDGSLEFDWIMKPGADFGQVKMHFEGQDDLDVDNLGNLKVGLRFTDMNFNIPESYQVTEKGKVSVSLAFNKLNSNTINFISQSIIDARYPLVIDPVLNWGTFMDGNLSNFDQYLFAIQIDPTDGMVYCAGSSNQNIPTGSAPYTANGYLNSVTGFVSNSNGVHVACLYRVNSSGTQLVDLTLFGPASVTGVTNGLSAYALSLSPTRVFVGGFTEVNIPAAGTQFDNTRNGTDGFVAVFSRDLGTLVYSTYLGSTGNETRGVTSIRAINDNSFAIGLTAVAALPASYISAGVADNTFAGSEMYIAKFSTLNTLAWGTYVGGTGNDVFNDIEVLADGRVAFAGYGNAAITEVNSAAAASAGTDNDGIIGVLNTTGTVFNYLDKIGGDRTDQILDVEIVGNTLYWTGSATNGSTLANEFPTTNGAYDTSSNGGTDVIVGSVSTTGGAATYKATFYGGGGNDIGSCLRLVTQTVCGGVSNSFLLVFGTSYSSGAALPTLNLNNEAFFNATNRGGG